MGLLSDDELLQTEAIQSGHPDVRVEREKTFRAKTIDAPLRKKQLNILGKEQKTREGQLKIDQSREFRDNVTFRLSMFDRMKPFLIWFGIILLIIGPGASAVMAIIGQMNLFYWIGFIIVGILIWRNL